MKSGRKHGVKITVPVGSAMKEVAVRNEAGTDVPPLTACGTLISEKVTDLDIVKVNTVVVVE